jgi:Zn-dependent M28 family amino/carboxypeptidase
MGNYRQAAFLFAALVLAGGLIMTGDSKNMQADAKAHPEEAAWGQFTSGGLLSVIKVLSSDVFEGRAPASKGEELSTSYIEKGFTDIGVKPGNPDGTYFQKVPMVGMTVDPGAQLVFTRDSGGEKQRLMFGDDFVAWTVRELPQVHVNAEMVFVGYGVVEPEYHWDDFKGTDVKGKVIVVLVNDPPVPDPDDPSKLDEHVFKGKAMTYYGRWTYKYEEAARKGAAGCLIVHQTEPAGYPWGVVKGSNTGEHFSLLMRDKGMSRAGFEGWITYDKAKALFSMTGKDFDELEKAAVSRDFKPVPLGVKASLTLQSTIRHIDSKNVVAKLEGSDPALRDQYVIYTAHWDHLGIGPAVNGDKIYHGAVDNASGVAGLLEMARAFVQARPQPKRSILFLSVTAEERGLLGSQYYAEHPLYPLAKTAAEINMDGLNVLGKTKDITVIGLGMSTLDEYVKSVAAEQGRVVRPDAEPEKGYYYRSDHFNFAKVGVPALDPESGIDYVGKLEGWGLEKRNEYTANDYHKPSDKIKPDWNMSGAIQDLQLLFSVGYRVADAKALPEWSPGTEFKARRDEMMKGQ